MQFLSFSHGKLDKDIIDGWYAELERMNEVQYMAILIYLYSYLPYRQTEGVVRAHATNKIPSIPDYSTIILAYR